MKYDGFQVMFLNQIFQFIRNDFLFHRPPVVMGNDKVEILIFRTKSFL